MPTLARSATPIVFVFVIVLDGSALVATGDPSIGEGVAVSGLAEGTSSEPAAVAAAPAGDFGLALPHDATPTSATDSATQSATRVAPLAFERHG